MRFIIISLFILFTLDCVCQPIKKTKVTDSTLIFGKAVLNTVLYTEPNKEKVLTYKLDRQSVILVYSKVKSNHVWDKNEYYYVVYTIDWRGYIPVDKLILEYSDSLYLADKGEEGILIRKAVAKQKIDSLRITNERISDSIELARQIEYESTKKKNDSIYRAEERANKLAEINKYKSIWISRFGVTNFNKFKTQILNGEVSIGMTKTMVLISWGKPKDINRTVTAYSENEQWVYDSSYLYFTNGVLTSFQD